MIYKKETMKQFRKFIEAINLKIKQSDDYKEKEILDEIKQKIQSCCEKDSNNDFYEQLKRMEILFSNFVQGDYKAIEKAIKNKQYKKSEIYLCRSIFRKLARKYGDEKYYDVLKILPKRPKIKLLPKKSNNF